MFITEDAIRPMQPIEQQDLGVIPLVSQRPQKHDPTTICKKIHQEMEGITTEGL